MLTDRIRTLVLAGAFGVFTAGVAAAQVSPTAPPHPNMPWNTYNAQGQVIRYIQVPAQQVTIAVPVPVPPGAEPQPPQQQTLEIPGYTVAETTTGYIYPARYTLQQTSGGYQWVLLPQQFQRK